MTSQQPEHTQWTLSLYLRRLVANNFMGGARRKSSESGRSFGESTSLSFLLVFSRELLLCWLWRQIATSRSTCTLFTMDFLLKLKRLKQKYLSFYTLTLQMGHIFYGRLGDYWTKLEQVRCPFCEQITVDQNINTYLGFCISRTVLRTEFTGRMKNMTVENMRLI